MGTLSYLDVVLGVPASGNTVVTYLAGLPDLVGVAALFSAFQQGGVAQALLSLHFLLRGGMIGLLRFSFDWWVGRFTRAFNTSF